MDFGLLHRSPQRQLARRQRPFLRSLGFAFGDAYVVVIFVNRIRFDVSQVSQLRLAEALVAEAFHNAADFRSGSQSAMGECGGALPPIGRHKSPGVAFTHPQDLGGLGCR